MSDQPAPAPPAPAVPAPPMKATSLRSRVRKNPALKIFTVLSGITIFFAFLVAIAELLSIVFIKSMSLPGMVLRLYALFFCLLVLLSELELTKHVRESFLVTSWICRGIFYVFVGTLVYQLKPEADFNDMQDIYIKVTSVALVILGLIYAGLGALCVKRWRDGMLGKYKTLMAHAEMSDAIRQEAGLLDAANNL